MIISVVIPILRPDAHLERLLSSLSRQVGAREQLEILCINNLERYRSLDLASRWKEFFYSFSYHTTGVKSANIARNLGIRFALGDIIFFVDSDCVVRDPQFMQKLQALHQTHPDVLAIGGPYTLPDNANKLSQRYFAIADMWLRASIYTPEGLTTALLGGNCSYKRSVFTRGLNFDLGRSYGGTEVSLNHRIHLLGEKILFVDSLKIEHYLDLSLKDFLYKAFKQGQGKAYNKTQNNIDQSHLLKEQIFAANDLYSKLYDSFFHLGHNLNIKNGSFSGYLVAILDFLFLESLRRRLWWLKMPFYYIARYLWWFKIPYYFIKKYLWYLKMPFYYFYNYLSRIFNIYILGNTGHIYRAFSRIGYMAWEVVHFSRRVGWRIYHLMRIPVIKVYYMAKYHIETYILPYVRKKD